LPTEQGDFISEAFIERLRNAPVNFCPKPKPKPKSQPKFLVTKAPTKDAVSWVIRTRCNSRWNSQIVKGRVVRNSRHYWYSLDMDYAVSVLITHLRQSNFTFKSSNKRKPVRYRISMSDTGKRFKGTATVNDVGCTQIKGELQ